MKRSIFDPAVKADLLARLDKLNESTSPNWGTMKANQMLQHLQMSFKVGPGELPIKEESTFFTRTVLRYFMLRGMVPSKERLEKSPPQTFDEINIIKSHIPVSDFYTEKENFKKYFEKVASHESFIPRHPRIGNMTRNDWGHQIYSHINYHFTQFGV